MGRQTPKNTSGLATGNEDRIASGESPTVELVQFRHETFDMVSGVGMSGVVTMFAVTTALDEQFSSSFDENRTKMDESR